MCNTPYSRGTDALIPSVTARKPIPLCNGSKLLGARIQIGLRPPGPVASLTELSTHLVESPTWSPCYCSGLTWTRSDWKLFFSLNQAYLMHALTRNLTPLWSPQGLLQWSNISFIKLGSHENILKTFHTKGKHLAYNLVIMCNNKGLTNTRQSTTLQLISYPFLNFTLSCPSIMSTTILYKHTTITYT